MNYQTIVMDVDASKVATVTLARPEAMNSFNQRMCEEFSAVWTEVRENDEIHAVVIRAEGDRAFSAGADVKEGLTQADNPWSRLDPGVMLSPKQNQVWKPVVTAIHGMAAAGAFYWINESDIVICSEDAQFFDPHVTYGMVAALEPIGLVRRIPIGEVMRMVLMGLDERIGAARAHQIGLVSEVVDRDRLWARADEIAVSIAAKPAAAIQGTVRAVWESLDLPRSVALQQGMSYTTIGNPLGQAEVDRWSTPRPPVVVR